MLQEMKRLSFGERLRKLREEKSKTTIIHQKDVAEALGLSARAYCRYENDDRQPDLFTLARICKYFDISSDYLIGLTDVPEPYKKS